MDVGDRAFLPAHRRQVGLIEMANSSNGAKGASNTSPAAKCDIGVIGLATMGANLARNAARNGRAVAVYNRSAERTTQLIERHGGEGRFTPCDSLKTFVDALRIPRSIIMSVAAGGAVDDLIGQLSPLLEPGDILIDAGNSHFSDTERRIATAEAAGVRYIGMGVSGGEKGALEGPSMMPGGSLSAYRELAPILEAMAAEVGGEPCCAYVGPGGAGHYVKMVHNGIEYGDMQAIAETYDVLRSRYGLDAPAIADVFAGWANGDLASYLVDITVDVLRFREDRTGQPLIDLVLDEAAQTGTGRWTAADALELGIAATATSAAVAARSLSSRGELRKRAAARMGTSKPVPLRIADADVHDLGDALLGARIVAFSQGFEQLSAASAKHNWQLDLGAVASLWRGGCIIRAAILDHVIEAQGVTVEEPLLLLPWFRDTIERVEPGWRRVVARAIEDAVPVPVLSSSLTYIDGLRQERSPANLIQGLRDEFGSHRYRRIGSETDQHTDWSGDGQDSR